MVPLLGVVQRDLVGVQRTSARLNEADAITLQARGYGFESRWLHHLGLSEPIFEVLDQALMLEYSTKVQQRLLAEVPRRPRRPLRAEVPYLVPTARGRLS